MANDNTTNNATQDTTVNADVKKFVLKFGGFDTTRPGVVCESENFWSELYNEYSEIEGKRLLIGHFISAQNYKSYENKQPEPIWSYNVNTNTTTTTIYAAPSITFFPLHGDLETMQRALTQAKISATFFDGQISKHLTSVGIPATRANVRVYRKSYTSQISKLLIEEILTKRSTATVARWFDKLNGNSYYSVCLSNGAFSINVPLAYGYGDAENLVVRALRLEQPRTVSACNVLERNGITVVDLGYCTRGELYKAAFRI